MTAMRAKEARTWAILCHLGFFAGAIIPFGHIIAPLVIWLIKRDESAFVDDQGKEAVNFQITITIYFIIASFLVFVLVGLLLLPALAIYAFVIVIVAAVKANDGLKFRYPLSIRFIK